MNNLTIEEILRNYEERNIRIILDNGNIVATIKEA